MVERSLSMREVPGSIPGASILHFIIIIIFIFKDSRRKKEDIEIFVIMINERRLFHTQNSKM